MKSKTTNPKFDKSLLEILACPEAVSHNSKKVGYGKLRLFKDSWLISDDSGYKYPIIKGVPILLREVGKKWKAKSQSQLPVPPPDKY